MPTALTTLRSTIATALTNAGVWSVFSFPPETILANSVVVAPSDPYIEPSNNSQNLSPKANFNIIMTVPMFDNQGNLAGIEDTIVAVFQKLLASNLTYNISAITAPSVLDVASGSLLTASFQLSVLTTWS
tara:strand:- start:3068 stop:3457 length:390 start_codon:yes stop_codon:yes gene_type:complete